MYYSFVYLYIPIDLRRKSLVSCSRGYGGHVRKGIKNATVIFWGVYAQLDAIGKFDTRLKCVKCLQRLLDLYGMRTIYAQHDNKRNIGRSRGRSLHPQGSKRTQFGKKQKKYRSRTKRVSQNKHSSQGGACFPSVNVCFFIISTIHALFYWYQQLTMVSCSLCRVALPS